MKNLVKVAKANFVAVLSNVNEKFVSNVKKQGLFTVQEFRNANGELVAKKVMNRTGGVGYQVAQNLVNNVVEKVVEGWELVKATAEEFMAVLSNPAVKVVASVKKQGLFKVTEFKNLAGVVIAKKVENKTGGIGYYA